MNGPEKSEEKEDSGDKGRGTRASRQGPDLEVESIIPPSDKAGGRIISFQRFGMFISPNRAIKAIHIQVQGLASKVFSASFPGCSVKINQVPTYDGPITWCMLTWFLKNRDSL